MSTWNKRIEAVFSVNLPIGQGSGSSLIDPLEIRKITDDNPEEIISQWMHYRSFLEEKEQKLIRKVHILLDGKYIVRYDMQCCSHSFTEDVSRVEHLYFDISPWMQEMIPVTGDEPGVFEDELPQLFVNLQDYIDFYLDDDDLSRTVEKDGYSIELKRCPDGGRWMLILEDLVNARAAGTFLSPFDPTPQNLHQFEEQCRKLAELVNMEMPVL